MAGQLITGNKVTTSTIFTYIDIEMFRYMIYLIPRYLSISVFQLTFSILAQLKGKLLIKCELPDDLKTETNEILGWVLPAPAAASATQDKVS